MLAEEVIYHVKLQLKTSINIIKLQLQTVKKFISKFITTITVDNHNP